MATVRAPLLSLAASGTIGGKVQFRRSAGRSIVCLPRKLRGFDGPNSRARRALFSGLARMWQHMSAATRDDWTNAMAISDASPWAAFLRTNLTRWGHYLQPAEARPDIDAATPGFPGLSTGIKSGFYYSLIYGVATGTDTFFAICHHSLTNGFTPSRSTAIDMQPLWPANLNRRVLGKFSAGTHYFRITTANHHGNELRLGTQLAVTFP